MPFIDKILQYKSLSIVGMEKNTGKTECLNYVLGRLPESLNIAVTSIGIDGENTDQVTNTVKPEIYLRKGIYFGTSEKHYRYRNLVSEVCDVSRFTTSLGRIVTSKVLYGGKALISGPSSSSDLSKWMSGLDRFDIGLTIIDGAISRKSSASPAISESMILATGAALSANISTLVAKTAYTVQLIRLAGCEEVLKSELERFGNGIWVRERNSGAYVELAVQSSFLADEFGSEVLCGADTIYLTGALTDGFLKKLRCNCKDIRVIVRDFTKIFVTAAEYAAFIRGGGKIEVLNRPELIAVCVNPVSPSGFILDSDKLEYELERAIGLKVYNLRKFKTDNL